MSRIERAKEAARQRIRQSGLRPTRQRLALAQLLFENGGPTLQLMTVSGVRSMSEILPDAFGPDALDLS